jgi:predicted transporter
VPVLLGMPAFAPLMMAEMRPVAMGSLIGHLIYGLILGAGFVALRRWAAKKEDAATRLRRAA